MVTEALCLERDPLRLAVNVWVLVGGTVFVNVTVGVGGRDLVRDGENDRLSDPEGELEPEKALRDRERDREKVAEGVGGGDTVVLLD